VTRRRKVCAAGVAMLCATIAACQRHEAYEKPLTPVMIVDVGRPAEDLSLQYSAVVEPERRLDLAFRVGGYVSSLGSVNGRTIEAGDRVEAGAVLATVRGEDYQARVGQAESQLADASAARGAAAQALARAERLFAAKSLTQAELDQARAAVESIDAKIAGARSLVDEAQLSKNDTMLRAPMTGVVLKRLVEVGSLVGPGVPAFVLANTRTVSVVIVVPDTMLAMFPAQSVARVNSEALPDRSYDGRVSAVSPSADPRSRLFEVKLNLANADGALKPGMVVTVDVSSRAGKESRAPQPFVVPLSAVVRAPEGGDRYAVFVIEERDGGAVARLRNVQLGRLLGNDITVASGLTGNERVITQGASIVADGERVNPTR
jgi:RND family efflux transporter MFP subunit